MPALADLLETIDVGAHHAGRIFRGLHRDLRPIEQIADLGWRRIDRLRQGARLAQVQIAARVSSPDGATKLLFQLEDGARVEGVLIPTRRDRVTLCVSSQVGCAMGCAFCATGRMGLSRGLSAGEIVAQVHLARAELAAAGSRLTHVVFMGMGEPLHDYPTTRDALEILLDPHGPSFKARHLTVSTVGLVPGIDRLGADLGGRVQLALSLHAGTDVTRRRLIPAARTWDLEALRRALLGYPLPGRRCLMIEYVVLPGINDHPEELDALADWTRGLRCLVNLIPFNLIPSNLIPSNLIPSNLIPSNLIPSNLIPPVALRTPSRAEVEAVAARLQRRRVPVSIRWPRGGGAAGACGQLALSEGPSR